MIEELIVSKLDPIFNQQVYLDIAPQGAPLPRAVYTVISQSPDFTIAGPSGYKATQIQIDVWAATVEEARYQAYYTFTELTKNEKGFKVTSAERLANEHDEELKIHACRWEYRLELI